MLERLRRSLAFRLAVQYSVVFALVAGLLFSVLYWELANALEARDRAAVEQLAGQLGHVYDLGGNGALRIELNSNGSPDVRSYFVRVIDSSNVPVFSWVPPDWIQTQVQKIPLPASWGITATRQIRSVRIPDNALKDYTIATTQLSDGSMLQVGRSIDSRTASAPLWATALGFRIPPPMVDVVGTCGPLRAYGEVCEHLVPVSSARGRQPHFIRDLCGHPM